MAIQFESSLDVNGKFTLGSAFVPTSTEQENLINIIVGTNSNGSQNGIAFYENSGGYGMKLGYDGAGSGASNALRIYDANDAAFVTFQNGGNVGIGTLIPAYKLDVNGALHSSNITIADYIIHEGDTTTYAGFGGADYFTVATDGTDRLQVYNTGVFVSTPLYVADKIAHTGDSNTYMSFPSNDNISWYTNGSARMHIDSSGNVGIGTTNPEQKLHVAGNMRLQNQLYDSTNSQGTLGQVLSKVSAGTQWIDGSAISGVPDGSGTANYTARWTDTDTLGTGVLYDNGTNVGIGTTSPSATLDVNGAGNFSGGTVVSGIDTTTNVGLAIAKGDYLYSNDGNYLRRLIGQQSGGSIDIGQQGTGLIGNINFFPGTSGNIIFYASGSENMRVASSGNVGIGTTNPTEKLHIADTNAPTIRLQVTSPGQYPVYGKIDTGNGFLTWANVTLPGQIIGSRWQFTGPPLSGRGDTYINLHDTNGIDVIVKDSQVVKIEDGGNVGIGTTSPSAKLDVSGTVNASQGYSTNNTSRKYFWKTDNTGNSGNIWKKIGTYNSDGQSSRIMITATGTTSYGAGTKPGKMTIIAQVNNNNLLEGSFWQEGMAGQYGDVGFVSNSATSHDIYYQVGSYAEYAYEAIVSDGTFTTDSTTVSTPSFTHQPERNWNVNNNLLVNSSGNVGIGTTNPSYTLDVNGSLHSTNLTIADAIYHEGDGNTYIQFVANDTIRWVTSGAERMRLNSSGNVGIGTTNPDSKLHVLDTLPKFEIQSDNLYPDAYIDFTSSLGNNVSRIYSYSNPGGSGLDLSYEGFGITSNSSRIQLKNGFMYFSTAGSIRAAILSNGNVGIGTTNPTTKLHVEGNVLFSSNLRIGGSNTFKSCTYGAQNGLVVGQNNVLGGIANGIVGVGNTIECTAEPWNSFGGNFVAGRNNTINNQYSHANAVFGQDNTVGDPTNSMNNVAGTLVSGIFHSTFGDNSFAFGESCFTDIYADRSLTGGYDSNNFGGFGSVAIGAGATASTGNNQYAFGTGVTTPTTGSSAYGSDQFVVGKFNEYTNLAGRPHRFAVGNGASDASRDTPFCVIGSGTYTNGQVSINDADGYQYTSVPYSIFHVNGRATSSYSSTFTTTSDERVKKNIVDYSKGLAEIIQVQPKSYAFNGKGNTIEDVESIGVLAQEIKDVFPETVGTVNKKLNPEDEQETELYTVDISPVTYALINAIKELNAKVEALEARIQTLEEN